MSRRETITGLLALVCAGCLIEPVEMSEPVDGSEAGKVTLSLELPWLGGRDLAVKEGFNPWDGQGLFRLGVFPKLVRVAVEHEAADGSYELASATWPDSTSGVGEGEDSQGAVELELEVPAGAGRRIVVLGFHAQPDGTVALYGEREPARVDLAAGKAADVSIDVEQLTAGQVEGTVRCRSGNVASWAPVAVSLVDARAQVVYPAVPLTPDQTTTALVFAVPSVGLGRPHWARVTLARASDGAQTFVDVRAPTFSVSDATEAAAVNLSIPCGF